MPEVLALPCESYDDSVLFPCMETIWKRFGGLMRGGTLILPNVHISSESIRPYTATHWAVLKEVVRRVEAEGGVPIVGIPRCRERVKEVLVSTRYDVEIGDTTAKWIGYPYLDLANQVDGVISVGKAFSSPGVGVVGSLANVAASWFDERDCWPQLEDYDHSLLDLYSQFQNVVCLSITDGVIGCQSGEAEGERHLWIDSGFMVASDDMWLADVAMAQLMGVSPLNIGYLRDIGRMTSRFPKVVLRGRFKSSEFALYAEWTKRMKVRRRRVREILDG